MNYMNHEGWALETGGFYYNLANTRIHVHLGLECGTDVFSMVATINRRSLSRATLLKIDMCEDTSGGYLRLYGDI